MQSCYRSTRFPAHAREGLSCWRPRCGASSGATRRGSGCAGAPRQQHCSSRDGCHHRHQPGLDRQLAVPVVDASRCNTVCQRSPCLKELAQKHNIYLVKTQFLTLSCISNFIKSHTVCLGPEEPSVRHRCVRSVHAWVRRLLRQPLQRPQLPELLSTRLRQAAALTRQPRQPQPRAARDGGTGRRRPPPLGPATPGGGCRGTPPGTTTHWVPPLPPPPCVAPHRTACG